VYVDKKRSSLYQSLLHTLKNAISTATKTTYVYQYKGKLDLCSELHYFQSLLQLHQLQETKGERSLELKQEETKFLNRYNLKRGLIPLSIAVHHICEDILNTIYQLQPGQICIFQLGTDRIS
jgi:hypothetical protein